MEPLQADDPREVGAYRLLGRLGGGGMGMVFLGTSPGGRHVAVKVVRRELAADREFRLRFAREVEAARRVGGFHTAPVVDADPHADPPWMVTAYIAGRPLAEVVAREGPLLPGAVAALGAALTEGLAAIHACGLIHRDLKPANIILAEDGPRIIDFGIARPAGATALTAPGTVIGTYAFMSPEQIRDDSVTPESDVFALGCVLGYAATGRAPFDASTVPAIMHRVLSEPPQLGGMSGMLRDTVAACLAKEPGRRPFLPDLIARFTAAARASGQVPAAGAASAVAAARAEDGGVPARGGGRDRTADEGAADEGAADEGAAGESAAGERAAGADAGAALRAGLDALPAELAARLRGLLADGAPCVRQPQAPAPQPAAGLAAGDRDADEQDAAGGTVAAHARDVHAESRGNVTITQQASASGQATVIQVAGSLKAGDDGQAGGVR